jgi:hypothetical protein
MLKIVALNLRNILYLHHQITTKQKHYDNFRNHRTCSKNSGRN